MQDTTFNVNGVSLPTPSFPLVLLTSVLAQEPTYSA